MAGEIPPVCRKMNKEGIIKLLLYLMQQAEIRSNTAQDECVSRFWNGQRIAYHDVLRLITDDNYFAEAISLMEGDHL